jgi:hypothetical protein
LKANKLLKQYPNCHLKKVYFKDYHFELTIDQTTYYIKTIKTNDNCILSINSKYVWEIRYGKRDGLSFKTTSKTILDMKSFQLYPHKIVVLKSQPYKILKYINESEVIDISSEKEVYDIKILNNIEEICV